MLPYFERFVQRFPTVEALASADESQVVERADGSLLRVDGVTVGSALIGQPFAAADGRPIGKYRLQAFPRATLCMACKQAEERH